MFVPKEVKRDSSGKNDKTKTATMGQNQQVSEEVSPEEEEVRY